MLQAMTCASPPALRTPAATSSQASALREEITTFAPNLASSSAEERPMPRLEPVTTATCPERSKGVDFMGVFLKRHSGMRRKAQARNPLRRKSTVRNGLRARIFDAPRNDEDS